MGELPRSVFDNLAAAARRWPDKAGLVFYDTQITFAELAAESEAIAGFLQQDCGVSNCDRVMDALPRSGAGKIQWLALQERENRRR